MPAQDYSQQVPAADRTLTLLETLVFHPDGLPSAELLAATGGSRSGLYALLNTLRARDYVVSEDGRHRLGPAMSFLVTARPPALDALVNAWRSETELLSLSESFALSWPDGQGAVIVAQAPASRPVRVVYQTGSRREGSSDVLVLAAGGAGDSPQMQAVRRTGRALSEGEEHIEVAVPVCEDGIRPLAAVLGGIPRHRAGAEAVSAITGQLRQLAARLSHHLGAPVYQPYGWVSTKGVGPMRDLTVEETTEFLNGVFGAQLACVRADGTPHVVPLWYEWDGAAMWIPASPGASWRTHITENPRVSVTIDEPWPPLRRAFLSGVAAEVPEDAVQGGIGGLRRRLAVRYLGHGATKRPELTDPAGWSAVRITPERIHGRQGLGPDQLRTAS